MQLIGEQTIELDCAPGAPRPGSYIADIVKGTILEGTPEADPDSTVSRLFGHWTWAFPKVSKADWAEVQKITGPRVERLYKEGRIRYGSW